MKRLSLFILILIFLFTAKVWAQELTLTLDEALALALRDNRDVLLKTEDVQKAKEKLAEARAGLLPTLSFTGTWSDTRGLYIKDIASTTTQATLKQYLYKGGKTVNTIRQNKDKLEVQEALLDKTKLETVFNVQKAFFTFLLAREFYGLNQEIMKNSQAHLEAAQARYKNGEASASDILKIKESLSSVNEALEASLNQVEATQSLLRNLLYLDENIGIKPDAQFVYAPKEIAYDEAFLQAMKNRPEIKQYAAQAQADKKAIEIAKSESRPNIYASWDYYSRSTTSLTFSPTKGWQDYNIIGLTFTWPLFDGWQTRAKVEQAIIDLKETQLTKEKTVKDIALELKNAYLDLANSMVKIRAQQAEIDLYEDTLKATQEKYKAGIASGIDLNDAALSYQVALFSQKQVIYDYLVAKARMEKAQGG